MAELEQVEPIANPIGDRLKSAREAQGLNLDDIAAKTRVPIRHLLHIEKGEWSELPATTYSVGFARAYAAAVGLDASEIGAQLRTQLAGSPAPIPSYYEPADPARVPPRWLALVAALIAIVLIIGYFVWRDDTLGEDEAPVVQAEEVAPAAAPAENAEVGPAAPPPATPTGPVVLTATNEVWLRVYEADGRRLFEGMMKPGDRYEVPATASRPQILTGRPNAVQVTVGSTRLPPLGAAETTVADVSLLPADLLARGSSPTSGPAPSQRAPRSVPPAPNAGSAPAPAPAAEAAPPATTP